jgi:Haem degrading protein HbpS-like
MKRSIGTLAGSMACAMMSLFATPTAAGTCAVDHAELTKALRASVKPSGGPTNGGLDNNEWAAVVARDGTVCAVTYSGEVLGDQWPASRAVAAEKAFTANGVSLPNFAMSTANLYAGSSPDGSLYGVITSNPPNPDLLYAGQASTYGTADDPMQGKIAGGVIVFGGGLPLYDSSGLVGALGVSGDTSCADHNIAWRVREKLGMDHVPAGVTDKNDDAIIYDIGKEGKSESGFGHPKCGGKAAQVAEEIGASATTASLFKNAKTAATKNRPHARVTTNGPDDVPTPGLNPP